MRADKPEMPDAGWAKARELVLRHGWNATCYQILNPGMALWFSRDGDAVVGYSAWGRVLVAAGAPVCAPERLREVATEFEAGARARGFGVCYFAAGSRLKASLGAGYAGVLVGAQPVWRPSAWPGIWAGRPSLRAQVFRARNKGVRVREWPAASAAASPELRRCLGEWLARRPMPPMQFLVQPETLGCLGDRRIFVAERAGRPEAYLVAAPVPGRRGWLIEQIVRARAAPNGVAEALVDAAFRAAGEEGLEYLTLGLSPLSRLDADSAGSRPWWLGLLFRWLRIHGGRFYNFRGLERFKSKFAPEEWEPIYAIGNESRFRIRSLLAIAAAFGGGSPLRFAGKALVKAARQEGLWLGRMLPGRAQFPE